MMNVWHTAFLSVKEVRAGGIRVHSSKAADEEAAGARGGGGGVEGEDWWDDVSHQAQRVAHVTAASAFASGGGEVTRASKTENRERHRVGFLLPRSYCSTVAVVASPYPLPGWTLVVCLTPSNDHMAQAVRPLVFHLGDMIYPIGRVLRKSLAPGREIVLCLL